jgi:hypothetical protein
MSLAEHRFCDSIRHLSSGWEVMPLIRQLDAHPELWNEHALRTTRYETPHNQVSDIWVRFNAWNKFDGDVDKFTMFPHVSIWYPCAAKIPAAWSLARKVMRHVKGKELGGVLITRIPAGGEVRPHIDQGWHAHHYEKFAVQIKGNKEQSFCFENEELHPLSGDLYTFNNSRLHWVTNHSNEERITLICCIRT